MSIPPPPSQPPSGGFGAPQDPPPGGFGAPVPPSGPAAPQAGPPQQQPPAVQPAYGYPQTGPGYGYPQQPGTPSPYGAPGAPVPAPQPPTPAPAGGNAKRTQLTIVGAAVLAIALIVGGGIWYTSGDGGGNKAEGNPSASPGNDKPQDYVPGTEKVPGNPKSKPLLNLPSPVPADVASVAGSWLTDSTYVKSDLGKVVGYNLVDGGKKWELPFPGELCEATTHVSENKTAVIFKPTQPTPENRAVPCSEVGVIDLESGKLVWSGNAKSATGGDKPVAFSSVTLSGKTVAAAGVSGAAPPGTSPTASPCGCPRSTQKAAVTSATAVARHSAPSASAARAPTTRCTGSSSTRPPARPRPRTSSPRASRTRTSSPPSP